MFVFPPAFKPFAALVRFYGVRRYFAVQKDKNLIAEKFLSAFSYEYLRAQCGQLLMDAILLQGTEALNFALPLSVLKLSGADLVRVVNTMLFTPLFANSIERDMRTIRSEVVGVQTLKVTSDGKIQLAFSVIGEASEYIARKWLFLGKTISKRVSQKVQGSLSGAYEYFNGTEESKPEFSRSQYTLLIVAKFLQLSLYIGLKNTFSHKAIQLGGALYVTSMFYETAEHIVYNHSYFVGEKHGSSFREMICKDNLKAALWKGFTVASSAITYEVIRCYCVASNWAILEALAEPLANAVYSIMPDLLEMPHQYYTKQKVNILDDKEDFMLGYDSMSHA